MRWHCRGSLADAAAASVCGCGCGWLTGLGAGLLEQIPYVQSEQPLGGPADTGLSVKLSFCFAA